MMPVWRFAGALAVALATSSTSALAQVKIESKAAEITLTGRLHLQWNTTSVDGPISNEFLIRRARLTAEIDFNDWISGKIQPDYGEGGISLKDAYLRLSFDPAIRATLGQFKRPFDLFELTSSTQILVIERAGGIRGVDTCAGPGGICTYSRLTEKLGYSDRDIGVLLEGDLGDRVEYSASVTNGTGANTEEENGSKSFTGRLAVAAAPDLTVAANAGVHDYERENALGVMENEYATAFGADLEYGNYSSGLHLQAGITAGDNWQNLDATGDPTTFVTAQGILTYKLPLSDSRFLEAIEPVARLSWGDPDTDADDDEGILFTPGLVAFFAGRNKLAINADIWSPSQGDTELSVKVQSYLHF